MGLSTEAEFSPKREEADWLRSQSARSRLKRGVGYPPLAEDQVNSQDLDSPGPFLMRGRKDPQSTKGHWQDPLSCSTGTFGLPGGQAEQGARLPFGEPSILKSGAAFLLGSRDRIKACSRKKPLQQEVPSGGGCPKGAVGRGAEEGHSPDGARTDLPDLLPSLKGRRKMRRGGV